MTCCRSAYKQNDMIYRNYRFGQVRNENAGVGRWSTAGEGLAQLPTDSRSCSDKDLPIVFLFLWLYFSKMFFFLVLFSGHQTSLQLSSPAAAPPPPPTLLLAVSTCLFYLAADSLQAIHSLTCRCPEADMTFMPFKKSCTKLNCGGPTSTYSSSPEGNFCCQATMLPPIHPSIGPCIHHCRHPIHLDSCHVGGWVGGDFETPTLEPLGLPEYAHSE